MSRDPQTIIGRAAELSGFEGFLRDIEDGPTAVLLEGEVGIGKTVLWKEGLAAAAARSYQVLACRPIEAETQLAYAALGDLLAEVPDELLGELPEPQRRALEVALLRREPVGSSRCSGRWRSERSASCARSPGRARCSSGSTTSSG